MKRLIFCVAFAAGITAIFYGCKKTAIPDQDLISEAHAFFTGQIRRAPSASPGSSPRTSRSRTLLWDQARTIDHANGFAILVPVHYADPIFLKSNLDATHIYSIDQIVHLLLYKDAMGSFHAEMVTAIPDSLFDPRKADAFTGLVLIENWSGSPIARIHATKNAIGIDRVGPEATTQVAGLITETCYEIDGYNYSPDDPDNGESWSEDAGCTANYYLGTASSQIGVAAKTYIDIGGGGGGTPPSPAASFKIISGESPIANIADYNKCFTNTPGSDHVYNVTVCVDQPDPGTREPWGFSASGIGGSSGGQNPVDVGHTFLILTEITPFGTITRNVGFFPTGSVSPISPSDPGQLNNNQNHGYNISLTISITNSQFFQILEYVDQGNGFIYDLNSNNCTTFALNALRTAGINLPSTYGTWVGGGGNDPGDLGEDIRNMTMSANMSMSTVDSGHPNQGACN